MGMASGSPWVVPSWERIVSPSTNSSVGAWYVLLSGSKKWTESSDVVEGNLSVQGIEHIACIN